MPVNVKQFLYNFQSLATAYGKLNYLDKQGFFGCRWLNLMMRQLLRLDDGRLSLGGSLGRHHNHLHRLVFVRLTLAVTVGARLHIGNVMGLKNTYKFIPPFSSQDGSAAMKVICSKFYQKFKNARNWESKLKEPSFSPMAPKILNSIYVCTYFFKNNKSPADKIGASTFLKLCVIKSLLQAKNKFLRTTPWRTTFGGSKHHFVRTFAIALRVRGHSSSVDCKQNKSQLEIIGKSAH
jgi:hypothetical protein